MNKKSFKSYVKRIVKPLSIDWIYFKAPAKTSIIDLGGGLESAAHFSNRKDLTYYSIDLDTPTHSTKKNNIANLLAYDGTVEDLERVLKKISVTPSCFVCTHVIEHIPEWEKYINAIFNKFPTIKYCYISTPTTKSQYFPKRRGNLNFFDDKTHLKPILLNEIEALALRHKFKTLKSIESYQPPILYLIGMIIEPLSAYRNAIMFGTREFYGQDSIYIGYRET